ncbi:MAG: class I adenylate-forming enzyme family protein [Chloroflexota bacterium]
MTAESTSQTMANILSARTVRDVAPDVYMTPYANIADVLETHTRTQPEKLFLTYYDDVGKPLTYSYAQFSARVAQVAHFLVHDCGVQRGERVATISYNHPDTVFVYFACWLIGATVAPQNVAEDDVRIAFILRNAEARIILTRPEYMDRIKRIRQDAVNIQRVVWMDDVWHKALDSRPTTFEAKYLPDLEDEALLVYTSGTTGAPKGVQLVQYNLLVDAKGICDWQGIDGDHRLMCILPIHHVNGIVVTLVAPLYVGASVVLNRGFKASTFWQRLAEERIHIVSLVPTILQFLCEADAKIATYDLSHFRHFICGAGTLAVTLVERFEAQFGLKILHGYGLSETTCYSCFLPVDLNNDTYQYWMTSLGYPSIGVPIDPNEMAIHDPEGQEVLEGGRGEIVIRGHNVMVGYFQRPDANAETFKHGWFRSGDEGFVQRDSQGRPFFFITGRIKELINRGGVKYSPFEIEEILSSIPGVRVGLAVAFENTYYGEEVGAYVVLHEGTQLTEGHILSYCRAHMPFAKSPKVVVFGKDIPATSTGKYQRLRLKDLFTQWTEVQFKER